MMYKYIRYLTKKSMTLEEEAKKLRGGEETNDNKQ